MRILVCGGDGMLARAIIRGGEHDYSTTVRRSQGDDPKRIFFDDYSDLTKVRALVHGFSVVINCIAERHLEKCETLPDSAYRTNVSIAALLAHACRCEGVFFIQISTDYVFPGNNRDPIYYPDSPVNPLSVYGITKHLAECRVRHIDPTACILRIPVLFTDEPRSLDESAVSVLARRVMNRTEPIIEDNTTIRHPLLVSDVARFIRDVIIPSRPCGIVHFSDKHDKGLTKWEQTVMISEIMGFTLPTGSRPKDASVSLTSIRPDHIHLHDPRYDHDELVVPIREGLLRSLRCVVHPRPYSDQQGRLCVLIDLDNTLLDSHQLCFRSYRHAWEETQGSCFPIAEDEFLGIIWKENIADHLRTRFDVRDWGDFVERKTEYAMANMDTLSLMPGAAEFLDWLYGSDIRSCVVTNSSRRTVDAIIHHHPILARIPNWVTKDDVVRPKPHPDCYEEALRLLAIDPSEDVVVGFEDSLIGYRALSSVATRIYIVLSPLTRDLSLSFFRTRDTYIINDLRQFLDP